MLGDLRQGSFKEIGEKSNQNEKQKIINDNKIMVKILLI